MNTQHELRYAVKAAQDYVLMELVGALDQNTTDELRDIFATLAPKAGSTLVLDMSGVASVDADGLGTLITMQKRLTEVGGRVALVGCQNAVRDALVLTRLEILFPQYPAIKQVPRSWQ